MGSPSLSLSTLPWGLLMQFPRCVWLAAVSMAVPKDCGGVWCQVWCHVSLYCSHSKASLTIVLCVCVEALCVCRLQISTDTQSFESSVKVQSYHSRGPADLMWRHEAEYLCRPIRKRPEHTSPFPAPCFATFTSFKLIFKFEAGGERANGRTTPPKFAFLVTDSVLRWLNSTQLPLRRH